MSSKPTIFFTTIISLSLLAFVIISLADFNQQQRTPSAASFHHTNNNNSDDQEDFAEKQSPSSTSPVMITTDDDEKNTTMIVNPITPSATESKKGGGVDIDISEFDPFPPFITAKNEKSSMISGSGLVEYIERNLFKDFTKGNFEFNAETKSFVCQKEEAKEDQQRPTPKNKKTSSSRSSNFFAAHDDETDKEKKDEWEPLTCLDKSTLPCGFMTGAGGPFLEYYPRFNNRTLFQNYCCGCSDKGRWRKPFAPNAFEALSSSDISIETLLKRIIGESSSSSKQQYPLSSSLGEISKILSQSGKNHDAQQLLEQLYIILGRNMHSKIVKTEQSKLMLLLGLSRLKQVNVDVLEPTLDATDNKDDDQESIRRYKIAEQEAREEGRTGKISSSNNKAYKHKRQRAPRVFLPGNSYIRALSSSIASVFRGQNRYFDRGSHGTVRYVVTNLGDYFWLEDTNATESKRSQRSPQQTTTVATANNSAQDTKSPRVREKENNNNVVGILPPIRLRKKGEVVFFEIVYQYKEGMGTRRNLWRVSKVTAEDFIVESPLVSPEVQAQELRGPFSAVFMRNFYIPSSWFYKFYGDQGLEDYCKWQMKTVMRQPKQQQQEKEEEDFYVALHASPARQYPRPHVKPTDYYAKYELNHGKPTFERERDELSSSGSPRHVYIPKPFNQPGETFAVIDTLSHSQCILVPHYPEVGKGLRKGKKTIDCSDVLSRNYWFKFSFGALMSAKSTRKKLMAGNEKK